MEVQYIGGKTWYRGVNLTNLFNDLTMIVPPKILSRTTPVNIPATIYIDDAVIYDDDNEWNNLLLYLRNNHPDGYDGTVDIAFNGMFTPYIKFFVRAGSSYGSSGYDVVCISEPGYGSWLYNDGSLWAQRSEWSSGWWDSERIIEHFDVPETAMVDIWEQYKNYLYNRVRFPRFVCPQITNQSITEPAPSGCWDESQFRYGTPSEGEILWTEEDIPVDTSWNKPRTKLISLHAWKLTNETELNYQKSLWSMDTDDTKISKSLYSNPMDCIVAENFIPFQADQSQYSAREQAILVGIQELAFNGSPVKAYFMTDEYKEFNFGSKVISRYFNDYRDFTETNIELYLPCIGWKNLDAQTYMGKELIIKYRLDFVTGDILALLITNPGNVIQDVVKGNCLSTIPISGRDFTNVLQARIQQQNGIMTAVGGFAGGALTVGAGVLAKNPMMIAGGVAGAVGSIAGGVQSARSGSVNVTKAQNQVVKDGNIGGSSGVLGYTKAYLVISRHEDAMPQRYQNYEGYQTNKLLTVNTLTGYIKAREVYFSSARATEQEKAMVEQMLKEGVFK